MAQNFPGPYQLQIQVYVGGYSRNLFYNLVCAGDPDPGDDFEDIPVVLKSTSLLDLSTITEDWITLLQPLYHNDADFQAAALWYCVPGTFEREFRSAYDVGTKPGTGGATYEIAHEQIMTFRTVGGGILRLTWEECIGTSNSRTALAAATGVNGAIRDFVLSDDNWIRARDDHWPMSPLSLCCGQNEKLWRKHYRA